MQLLHTASLVLCLALVPAESLQAEKRKFSEAEARRVQRSALLVTSFTVNGFDIGSSFWLRAHKKLKQHNRGSDLTTSDRMANAAAPIEDRAAPPPVALEDVVAHINHVVKIAGINAVGIGSDFGGTNSMPTGLEDVSMFPNLTLALPEEGYSASNIRKIFGGNTLRLMLAVEKAARIDGQALRKCSIEF